MKTENNYSMEELKNQNLSQRLSTFEDIKGNPQKFDVMLVSVLAMLTPRKIKIADEIINGGIHFFVSGESGAGKSWAFAKLNRVFEEEINHIYLLNIVDAYTHLEHMGEEILKPNTLLVLDDMNENPKEIVENITKYFKGIKRSGKYFKINGGLGGFIDTNVSTVQIFEKLPIQVLSNFSNISDVCVTVFPNMNNPLAVISENVSEKQRDINIAAIKDAKEFINNAEIDDIVILPFAEMTKYSQVCDWLFKKFIGVNFQNFGGPMQFNNIIKLAVAYSAFRGNRENGKLIVTEKDFEKVITYFCSMHRTQANKERQYLIKK